MRGKIFAAAALAAALLLAALAGVERTTGRHLGHDVAGSVTLPAEPSLPSAAEAGDPDPSASPSLTR